MKTFVHASLPQEQNARIVHLYFSPIDIRSGNVHSDMRRRRCACTSGDKILCTQLQ